MKTKHNNGLTARFVVLLSLLSATVPVAQAQDFIKEVKNFIDDYSIIHEYKQDIWLTCNYNQGKSVFTMITDTGATVQQLTLGYFAQSDSTRINDFKIYNDTVYFCGQTWVGELTNAVWGYFPLPGFPYVPVYSTVRGYESFKKVEVFSVDPSSAEVHVVMTGNRTILNGVIVDNIRTAPHVFTEHESHVTYILPYPIFYDLIQTDNYIVVSQLHQVSGSSTPFITSFAKPTTLATPIFASTIHMTYVNTGNNEKNPLLTHCIGDALSIVSRFNNTYTVVGLLDPLTLHAAITFSDSSDALWNQVDLCYNRDNKDLNILARNTFSQSKIYHIPYGVAFIPGPIPIRWYPNDNLNSLDYLTTLPNYIIASGHGIAGQKLRIYRHNDIQRPVCAELDGGDSSPVTLNWEPEKTQYNYNSESVEILPHEAFPMVTPITTECE